MCTMNVTLDAVIVQTEAEGFRAVNDDGGGLRHCTWALFLRRFLTSETAANQRMR